MSEKCPKTNIAGCPYLDEYELDDIQGCVLACFNPKTPTAIMFPEECLLDVCAETKAAEDKRGEEVLEMACRGTIPEYEQSLRQAYKERYDQG